jgi:FkbM family methyltransferase
MFTIAGRSPSTIFRSIFKKQHYRALLVGMLKLPQFPDCLFRYLSGCGRYPFQAFVRTPTGLIGITLYSHSDMLTLNEIFCRGDYACPRDTRVVVDIGSNIGISALYFLTRNPATRCYLFEPVPRNVERLKANLEPFRDRYSILQLAIGDSTGILDFGINPDGRHCGLLVAGEEHIEVKCQEINEALSEILQKETQIDVLKVDIEGDEYQVVKLIKESIRDRIKLIMIEGTTGILRYERGASI